MCYRRTAAKVMGALGLSLLLTGALLVLTSSSFLCSVKDKQGCTGSCQYSCGETCFCTTDDHSQATIAAAPLFFAPLPLLFACILACGDEQLPRACFCVREDPFEELVEEVELTDAPGADDGGHED